MIGSQVNIFFPEKRICSRCGCEGNQSSHNGKDSESYNICTWCIDELEELCWAYCQSEGYDNFQKHIKTIGRDQWIKGFEEYKSKFHK